MLLTGYFEGIDSERALEWRCADSVSLREFLRLAERETVPNHSWLSSTRSASTWNCTSRCSTLGSLHRLSERGLIKSQRIVVDASTANAALRSSVRRNSGEG